MPEIRFSELTLSTVPELDRTIDQLFRKIMFDLSRDCENRPDDKTARVCKLAFKLTPIMDPASRELDYIEFEVEGKQAVPVYRTRKAQLRTDQGKLLFNRDLPGSLNQPSLYTEDGDDDQ